jgi:hypothetical protein
MKMAWFSFRIFFNKWRTVRFFALEEFEHEGGHFLKLAKSSTLAHAGN